jgi:hypothetical protein
MYDGLHNRKKQEGNMILRMLVIVFMLFSMVFSSGNGFCIAAGPDVKPDTAAQVIDRCIEASGGAALAEIKTEVRKGKLKRLSLGLVPFEITARAPGKWRYLQLFSWGDQVCFGFDGSSGWVQDTRGIAGMEPRQQLDLQLLLDFQAPLRIREIYPEMKIKGYEKIDDKEVVIIAARSREGIDAELAFDLKSGLLMRVGNIYLKDYRAVEGIQRPFKIILGNNQLQMEFSETQHNIELDESLFQQPGCVLPVKEPLFYKHREVAQVDTAAVEACTGEYQIAPGVIVTVSSQQNHLMMRITPSTLDVEIFPQSDTVYFREFENIEFHFMKDAEGKITHLMIHAGERKIKADKIK